MMIYTEGCKDNKDNCKFNRGFETFVSVSSILCNWFSFDTKFNLLGDLSCYVVQVAGWFKSLGGLSC